MSAPHRTVALPVPSAAELPAALVASPTWAAWKFIDRDGQRVKFPIDANPGPHQGKGAKANDERTWTTYAVAAAYAERHGYGLFFFLRAPFFGADADDCRDPETGELTPVAASVFGELDTYAEVSISGTGIKAIGYGRKPGTRCRRNGLKLEIYDHLRGFALTGHQLPDAPPAVNDCQAALDHIYGAAFGPAEEEAPPRRGPQPVTDDDDQTVIAWLRDYRHGARFAALWGGDTGAYNGDESAADLALASMLAFRVGPDPARIFRLVQASGLYRAKWERQDYRDRTIRKAIDGCRSFYTARPAPGPAGPAASRHDEPADAAEDTPPRVVELVERVAELEQAIEEERRQHAQTKRMLASFIAIRGNAHIKAERDTIAATVVEVKAEIANGRADPEGYVRQHTQRIAEKVGKSSQTTQTHIARAAEWGLFDRKLVAETDPNTSQRRTVYYIRPKEAPERLLEKLVSFVPPKADDQEGWGGKRTPCPRCGSTATKTVTSCAGCGLVIKESYHAGDDEPTTEEAIAGLRAERQPDEPRPDAASIPPTPITPPTQAPYPPGPVTHAAQADEDEPDDWDPYECNERGCTRRTLPDKRYCDWHDPQRLARFSPHHQTPPAHESSPPVGSPEPASAAAEERPPFIVHPGEPQGFSPVERATGGGGCQRCGTALYGPAAHCAPCGRIVAGLPLYAHQRDPLADRSGDQAAGGGG